MLIRFNEKATTVSMMLDDAILKYYNPEDKTSSFWSTLHHHYKRSNAKRATFAVSILFENTKNGRFSVKQWSL